MEKITAEMTAKAYELGKAVHRGSMTPKMAVDELARIGMARGSAKFFVSCYEHMIRGERYTRQTNTYSTDYFLQHIYQDEGIDGLAKALRALSLHIDYYEEVSGTTVPGKRAVLQKYRTLLGTVDDIIYPDEIEEGQDRKEGKARSVTVNTYERNVEARNECVAYFGATCQVCEFSFNARYGDIGKDFIHVHHIVELSTIGKEYTVDPIKDLIPVCPNCHAMLHKRKPAYTTHELKDRMQQAKASNGSN